jgi:hypothetical protein
MNLHSRSCAQSEPEGDLDAQRGTAGISLGLRCFVSADSLTLLRHNGEGKDAE